MQCLALPKDLKEWPAYKTLKTEIENLKDVMPLIIELKKSSIKIRHWEEVCKTTGKKINYENPDQLLIEELYNANLLAYNDDVLDITESADK